jgi:hypothetical protein
MRILQCIPGLGMRLFAGALGLTLLSVAPLVGVASDAQAQSRMTVTVDFRTALEPFGRWDSHPRWGEVWLPKVERGWRPYTVGRWVHTDQWGWYWVSADAEADWGWIAFHYGRWVHDRDRGWMWVPGTEWSPGWVQWRRGTQHVGWAPLPPEEVVVEYRDEPEVWIFVRPRDFVAPRIVEVILPPREVYIEQTVVVNRTVIIEDRGPRFAVNPGIPAGIIAAAVGRPLRSFDVRPRILAGTAQFRGAEIVSAQDLRQRRRGDRDRVRVRETSNVIRPAQRVSEPQPLAAKEPGRLGDTPPRAARGASVRRAPETSGAAPPPDRAAGSEARERRGGPDQAVRTPEERRDARDERRDSKEERRDAREQRRELRDERRDAREDRRENRESRDAREPQPRNERRDAREDRRENREERRESRDERRDTRESRRESREDAREQRRETVGRPMRGPQADRDRRGRSTEGRASPPDAAPPQAQPRREGRRDRGPDRPRASAPSPRPQMSAPPRRGGPPPAARAQAPSPQAASPRGPKGGGGGPPGGGHPGKGGGGGHPGKGDGGGGGGKGKKH